MAKEPRDVERAYPTEEVVAKLRRLADALESDGPFRIQIAGERIRVPKRARFSIEHERGDDEEEIEFQLKWRATDASPEGDEDEATRTSRRSEDGPPGALRPKAGRGAPRQAGR